MSEQPDSNPLDDEPLEEYEPLPFVDESNDDKDTDDAS